MLWFIITFQSSPKHVGKKLSWLISLSINTGFLISHAALTDESFANKSCSNNEDCRTYKCKSDFPIPLCVDNVCECLAYSTDYGEPCKKASDCKNCPRFKDCVNGTCDCGFP